MLIDNLHDVRQKIVGGIFSYKGEPVYVNNAHDAPVNLQIYHATSQEKSLIIKLDDPDFSLIPPQLGYLKSKETGWDYYSRLPVRRFKAGLHDGNVVVLGGADKRPINIVRRFWSIEWEPSYLRPIDAAKYASQTGHKEAFCRTVAVGKDGILYYKGSACGLLKRNGEFTLSDRYEFLNELIKEELERDSH